MIKEDDGTVISAGDNATFTPPIGGIAKRKKKKGEEMEEKDGKEIFENNDDWSYYKDQDMNVFEIKNQDAKGIYQMGLKRQQSNFWKQNETTNAMLQHMNDNRSRNFVVRFDGQNSFPLMKGF